MFLKHLTRRHALDQIKIIELCECFHCIIRFSRRFPCRGQPTPFVFDHVLEPGASPAARGDVTPYTMALCYQRRETPAIAQTHYKYPVGINELILVQRIESGPPSLKLDIKISL